MNSIAIFLKPCGQHLPRNLSATIQMTQRKPAGLTVAKRKDERPKKQTSRIDHRRFAGWFVRWCLSAGGWLACEHL